MLKQHLFLSGLILFLIFSCTSNDQKLVQYDIVIYGGSSAGVISACAASRLGKTVVIIEPGNRIGGLSSGGLGQTDIGNKHAFTISGSAEYKTLIADAILLTPADNY